MKKFTTLMFTLFMVTVSMPLLSQEQEQSTLEKLRQQQAIVAGTLTGKISDEKTGDDLIGANVFIVDTKLGASTDIDGKFQIKRIPEGTYDVRISFLGYETKLISGVVITTGEPVVLNVSLNEDQGLQQQEVVISASAIKSGEGAILAERKKSVSIGDGISSEQMKRAPDATSGDAMRRVPGVTIVDNKFVFVRGTSERYSNTTLNGTTVSGTEPDKKSFSFDMFPSNLLENIVIAKTFTPDVPGDFSGGNVQLSTIEFPELLNIKASVTGGYNTETTFQPFTSYSGGATDYLGIDDGTRSLPGGLPADFTKTNLSVAETKGIAGLFKNNWAPKQRTAPLNSSMELSAGNAFNITDESQIGFIGALTYKNSYTHSVIDRNDYQATGPKFEYKGTRSAYSVLWGGLFNVTYKFDPFHKISSKNVYNKSADDEVVTLAGVDYDGPNNKSTTAFRFNERSVLSSQIIGEHVFIDLNGSQLQWRMSNSESRREEPDYRRVTYYQDATDPSQPYRAVIDYQAQTRSGGRFYSSLKDIVRNYAFDLTVPVDQMKLKLGALYEDKDRSFNSRLIAFTAPFGMFDYTILEYGIDSLFSANNVKQDGFRLSEYSNGSNNYTAGNIVTATYAMVDVPFAVLEENFRFTGGARYENYGQTIQSFGLDGSPLKENPTNVDILPSLNLTYLLNENTNIRIAFSQTVNRPELRELAPFAYYDFNTQTSIYGNPKLKRALIKNYDVRFEVFPNPGEIISFSVFFKNMADAIEQVVVPGSALGADRTYDNATSATNEGYEFEFRTSLGHLTEHLAPFALTGNYTKVRSKVNVLSGVGIQKRDRPLQGQSPYMVNLGIIYTLPEYGINSSLMFNKFGERISEVATLYDEDVRELPRNVLDFTLTKSVTSSLESKFSIRDIFSEAQIFMQGTNVSRKNTMGTTYSLGFSYKY
jgi:TonB-dependent receptor